MLDLSRRETPDIVLKREKVDIATPELKVSPVMLSMPRVDIGSCCGFARGSAVNANVADVMRGSSEKF